MSIWKKQNGCALKLVALLGAELALATPVFAQDAAPSTEVSVAALSHYIWRGQELSRDSIVLQPSMTVEYKGISANLWSNLDTAPYSATAGSSNSSSLNETDVTLSYERQCGAINAKAGYIYYGLEAVDDSQELYVSLTADSLLSPSLTIYKEFDSYPNWYISFAFSHSFQLGEKALLELTGSISYLKSEDEDEYPEIDGDGNATGDKFSNWHDGMISAAVPISAGKYLTVTPSLTYVFGLSTDAHNEMKFLRSKSCNDSSYLYGGVAVSLVF